MVSSTAYAAICAAWCAVSEDSVHNPADALRRFYAELAPALRASRGIIALGARVIDRPDDPLVGWRPVTAHAFGEVSELWANDVDPLGDDMDTYLVPDPIARKVVEGPYVRRVIMRREHGPDFDEDTNPASHLMRLMGLHDRMIGVMPISSRAEMYMSFDRSTDQPLFTSDDRDILYEALPGLLRVGRSLALLFGLRGPTGMLTDREREVLSHLLLGESEHEIAEQLGMSKGNCHQRVVRIYRQLGVGSRGELLQLWLAGGAAFDTGESCALSRR